MPKVAVAKGISRYDNVLKALQLLEGDVKDKLSKSYSILIKPDLLQINGLVEKELSDVEAVKALLDFISEYNNKPVTIAEGSFIAGDVMHQQGFHELRDDYSVKFVNLDYDDFVPIRIGRQSVPVSKTVIRSDFRISLSLLKTDRRVSLLGSIPNIVLGSVANPRKSDVYHGRNLAKVISEVVKVVKPHLSVVDGFHAVRGSKILSTEVAIASTDSLAADAVAASILKLKSPGYFSHCRKAGIGKSSLRSIKILR